MTVLGSTRGSRPVRFTPPSVRPHTGVISDPAYVVGTASTGSSASSAQILARPVALPPPMLTTRSARTSRARVATAAATSAGTCWRTSSKRAARRPASSAAARSGNSPGTPAISSTRSAPRAAASAGRRSSAPSANTTRWPSQSAVNPVAPGAAGRPAAIAASFDTESGGTSGRAGCRAGPRQCPCGCQGLSSKFTRNCSGISGHQTAGGVSQSRPSQFSLILSMSVKYSIQLPHGSRM